MKKYDVYAIGNALVDIEYHADDSKLHELGIEKGLMTLIDEGRQNNLINNLGDSHESMACGGSAANSIIALAQMGAKTHFDCRVANDITGQFFADDLKRSGVFSKLDITTASRGVTGKCLVFVTPDADRTMNTFLGVSAELDHSDVDHDAIACSKYVYIEGYLVTGQCSRDAAVEVRRIAETRGIKTALTLSDPNMVMYFREGLEEMIGDGVDLLFANEDEAFELANSRDLGETVSMLKKIAKTFAITRGEQGAIVYDGNELLEIAARPVAAIDTLGAGDMFAGAFMYGLTQGMSYKRAAELASLASAQIVTQFGPRLEAGETQALLAGFNSGN
ncbi:MAG: adenosine kinase [Gammaproteobacteria bacterium]|nr:adenosine kinase [Gammaproteobacteria bacterium]